jgi:hypothetical protein
MPSQQLLPEQDDLLCELAEPRVQTPCALIRVAHRVDGRPYLLWLVDPIPDECPTHDGASRAQLIEANGHLVQARH